MKIERAFWLGNFCVLVIVVQRFLFFHVLSQRQVFIWGRFPLLRIVRDAVICISLLIAVLSTQDGARLCGAAMGAQSSNRRSPWALALVGLVPGTSALVGLGCPSGGFVFMAASGSDLQIRVRCLLILCHWLVSSG